MKSKWVLVTLCILFLSGCGEEEVPPVPTPPPLHTQAQSITWDGMEITEVTPVSAFEITDTCIQIFPYFNSEEYISIERIYVSENDFWNSVTSEYEGTPNHKKDTNWELFTLPSGITLGCVIIDDDECYIIRTEALSSAYVEKVCKMLCK